MKFKKYRAADRADALKQIRAELGPDAVIVSEQRVKQGPLGLFGSAIVEVLAAVEEGNLTTANRPAAARPAPSKPAAAPSAQPGVQASISPAARQVALQQAVAQQAAAQQAAVQPSPVVSSAAAASAPVAPKATPAPASTGAGASPQTISEEGAGRLAAILGELPKNGDSISPEMAARLTEMIAQAADTSEPEVPAGPAAPVARLSQASPAAPAPHGLPPSSSPMENGSDGGVMGAGEATPAAPATAAPVPSAPAAAGAPTAPAAPAPSLAAAPAAIPPAAPVAARTTLAEQFRRAQATRNARPVRSTAMREMQNTLLDLSAAVERLTRQTQEQQVPHESAVVREVYDFLVSQEVEPTVALDIVGQLDNEFGAARDVTPEALHARLLEVLEQRLPTATLSAAGDGPTVIVMVGPTGVGKTTTLAKLAAHLALTEGKKVCLATTDTFRVAAARQLGTYAEIMELPLEVIYTPAELKEAITRHADADVILVDTPGCSQRNDASLKELKAFVAGIPRATVLLTVAAPAKFSTMMEIQHAFATMPISGLVVTKLDESSVYGPVLCLIQRARRPVFYVTTGQNVPRDIEPANAVHLARLVVGDLLTQKKPSGRPRLKPVASPVGAPAERNTSTIQAVSEGGAA